MEKAADAVDAALAIFFYRCTIFCFVFHAFIKVNSLFCAIFGIFAHL